MELHRAIDDLDAALGAIINIIIIIFLVFVNAPFRHKGGILRWYVRPVFESFHTPRLDLIDQLTINNYIFSDQSLATIDWRIPWTRGPEAKWKMITCRLARWFMLVLRFQNPASRFTNLQNYNHTLLRWANRIKDRSDPTFLPTHSSSSGSRFPTFGSHRQYIVSLFPFFHSPLSSHLYPSQIFTVSALVNPSCIHCWIVTYEISTWISRFFLLLDKKK